MKRQLSFLFLSFSSLCTLGQALDWTAIYSGNSWVVDNDLATDNEGNIYSIGWFTGTADFDPSSSDYSLTSNGNEDIFLVKLDAERNFLWAKHYGGAGWDIGYSLAVDYGGNIFITGHFSGTANFETSPQQYNLTAIGSADIFVAKIDTDGNLQWAKTMGGSDNDFSYSIALGNNGSILTTGMFTNSCDFDPGTGVYTLSGFSNAFVSSLTQSGDFEWAKHFVGARGTSIAIGLDGNVYTTGTFFNSVDFDPGPSTFSLMAGGVNGFEQAIYISKLDDSGNFLLARKTAEGLTNTSAEVHVSDLGNVYLAGSFGGSTTFESNNPQSGLVSGGLSDAFVCKFDSVMNFVWCRGFGGTFIDRATSVATDCAENIYLLGYFGDTVDFDPGPNVHEVACAGTTDVFVLKLDNLGDFVWNAQLGGTGQEESSSIVIANDNSIHAFAKFSSQAVFTLDTISVPFSSNGEYGTGIIKLRQCAEPTPENIITVSSCGEYVSSSGIVYSVSGTYTEVNSNSTCCDSIVIIDLTITPFDTSVSVESNTLTANGSGSYLWLDCENQFSPIVGETNQTFSPTTNGNYALLISENSCVDTTDCFSITGIGIKENMPENVLRPYPNPTNGNIHIELDAVINDITINAFNALGSLVKTERRTVSGVIEYQIPDPTGVYLIQLLSTDGKVAYLKVLKE